MKVEDEADVWVERTKVVGKLECALQDEGVMSIAVETMTTTEPLIHDERKSKRCRGKPRNVERGILMSPDGVMEPADHMSARRCGRKREINGSTRLA